jgi:hypothetical protein
VSSDDVKVMTLEQLDDAFRLDVIDTSTPVWKAGMSTWSPLGLVAGIDDEPTTAHVPAHQEPAALWPPPAWPPQPHVAAPHVYAASNREAAPQRMSSPAPPVLRPTVPPSGPHLRQTAPAPSVRPAPAARPAPTVRPPAPSSRPAPPSARPAPVVANFAMPASIPPAAYSVAPASYARRKSSSGFGAWVLGLAVFAGALVTLYRNDLLLRAARAAHVEPQYLRIERTLLGGPSFGTLRSVAALKIREKLQELTGTSQGTVVQSPVVQPTPPAPVQAAVAPVAPPAPVDTPAPSPKATRAVDLSTLPVEGETPAPATPQQPAPAAKAAAPIKTAVAAPKPAAPAQVAKKERAEKPAPVESEPSDGLKAAMAGKGAKASNDAKQAAAPAPAKEATKASNELPRTASGHLDLKAAIGEAVKRIPAKKKKGGPGSEYDPMNGEL